MNYVLKTNTRNNKFFSTRSFKTLVGSLVALAFIYSIFPKALPYFFTILVKPLWNIEQNIRYGDSSVDELRAIYAKEEADSVKNNSLQKENENLKNLLDRSVVSHPLLATILKKPPFSAYDTFILDVGENANVKNGNKVYALGNIPIGEIAEVVGNTSRVKLYSSSGEKFVVSIGDSNVEAEAVGKGGGYFEVSLPRDTKIIQGDTVLIPSLSNSFAGTVEAITSEPSEPFSKIFFRQPINIYELRWVLVDTGQDTNKIENNGKKK